MKIFLYFCSAKMCLTMRKVLFFVSLALLWVGCQPSSNIADTIAKSKPIMPVRMSSDTVHVVLTDYVPVLYGDTTLWQGLQWTTGESLECINLVGTPQVVREMDIINRDRSIHAMTFHDKSGSFAIPVLPNKPVRQALVSLGYENDVLRVGFYDNTADNPSFEAFVQNSLIDHSLWQEEEDGTWTLDLGAISDQLSAFSLQRSQLFAHLRGGRAFPFQRHVVASARRQSSDGRQSVGSS